MFILSALIAVAGAVGYQYFVKRIPVTINPVVSIVGIYVSVLVLCFILLLLFSVQGGLVHHVRQLSWVQVAIAVSVFLIELGFLLMYRYGWFLSTGNLITGIAVNLVLVALGVFLLGEHLSLINIIGIFICLLGVVMVGYRS